MFGLTVGQTVVLACVLAVVLAVALTAWRAWWETMENHNTVCAILGITDESCRRETRVGYGRFGLPFTMGRPKRIRIVAPDKAIPGIRSMRQAADAGIQIASSLGMRESVADTRLRAHTWELT